jgi:hypothetical protein
LGGTAVDLAPKVASVKVRTINSTSASDPVYKKLQIHPRIHFPTKKSSISVLVVKDKIVGDLVADVQLHLKKDRKVVGLQKN